MEEEDDVVVVIFVRLFLSEGFETEDNGCDCGCDCGCLPSTDNGSECCLLLVPALTPVVVVALSVMISSPAVVEVLVSNAPVSAAVVVALVPLERGSPLPLPLTGA